MIDADNRVRSSERRPAAGWLLTILFITCLASHAPITALTTHVPFKQKRWIMNPYYPLDWVIELTPPDMQGWYYSGYVGWWRSFFRIEPPFIEPPFFVE